MRPLKMTVGMATVVCACAVMSVPAMAKEFTASRLPHACSIAEPCKTKGRGIGPGPDEQHPEYTQEFKFGFFLLVCKNAATIGKTVDEGAITWSGSQTFSTEVKFSKCKTIAHFGAFQGAIPTKFNGGLPVKFVYHVNGFVEQGSGETESEIEVGGTATTFKVGAKLCNISWPAQTVPIRAEKKPGGEYSDAVFSNPPGVPVPPTQINKFPSLTQQRMDITNAFKGMSWEYTEGQCVGEGGFEEEAPKTEAKTGAYFGTFEEEVSGGNLAFKP